MTDVVNPHVWQVFDANGDPVSNAQATFSQSGTSIPVGVFSDEAGLIPHAVPLLADAAGVFPPVFSPNGVELRVQVLTASGATVPGYPMDNALRQSAAANTALGTSFSPTVALPYDNVQEAIQGAVTAAASGFAPFGLGVTGTATLLANIDATNIGGGAYRFDGTTTGTFPAGIVAADTGIVETWRENSGSGVMMMYSDAGDKFFVRRMSASAWLPWRENITGAQGAVDGDTLVRASNVWTRLALGSSGKVLTSNGITTTWATPITPLGTSQTWQNMSASRVLGTSYQNLTGRSIQVSVCLDNSGNSFQMSVDGTVWVTLGSYPSSGKDTNGGIVPSNYYYRVSASGGTTIAWAELR